MGLNCKKNEWRNSLRLQQGGDSRQTGTKSIGTVAIIGGPENWASWQATKPVAHKLGLLHESVHIVIIKENKILLQLRGERKKQWPGYWDIIGEHVVTGDRSPLNVAQNVLKVEAGIDWIKPICEFDITEEMNYQPEKGKIKRDNEKRHVYVMKITSDIDIETLNNELGKIEQGKQETVRFEWFDMAAFEDLRKKGQLIPYTYMKGPLGDDFLGFFKEKEKTLGENDGR